MFIGLKTKILSKYDLLKRSVNNYYIKRNTTKDIRLDKQHLIPNKTSEIRLFAIMRNEALRLPYFIEYYKNIGVKRFFIVDNNSTDGSSDILSNKNNIHVFKTKENYRNHWYWMEYLLDNYGKNHWCVVVDIDELVSYPKFPDITLNELCNYLESKGTTAVRSILLDMYGNNPVSKITYIAGKNPIDSIPFFDKTYTTRPFNFFDKKNNSYFRTSIFTGGMRDRVFGETSPPAILSKISLFKNESKTYLYQGMHAISGANISEIQGVVFHTKFLFDFIGEVKEECKREQHFGDGFYYKIFNRKLVEVPEVNLCYEGSEKFKDTQQLVDLNLMKTTSEFDEYVADIIAKKENL